MRCASSAVRSSNPWEYRQRLSKPGDLVEVEQVGGNLEVEGGSHPDVQARGDHVQIEKRVGLILITCGGDLVVSMPEHANLLLGSIGGNVKVQDLAGSVELRFVGGDVTLRNLNGAVRLSGSVGGATRLENVADVSVNSAKASGSNDATETRRQIVEKVARRAAEKFKRAEQKVLQHSQVRSHRFETGRWKYRAGPDAFESIQPEQVVSDEERVAVLKMLHEKKITAKQAEELLTALEGGVRSNP